MIELQNVSRWYGQVIGLNDVTCQIGPGLTALLGMNGAGKSTLMRLVTGQLKPTTGDLRIFGMQPFANPEVYRRLGYCPEIDNFYEHLSGRKFVRFMGRLSGMSKAEAIARTDAVLEHVGMADRADKKIAGYSKGMRQRIKLAQAMIHDPDVILLDEPLNGLDPVGRREFLDVLGHLAASGKAILVSSHILFEVEQMTSSILLLHRGRLMASGDLRVIRSLMDKHPHQVRIVTPEPRRAAGLLADLPNVVSIRFDRDEGAVQLEVREPDAFYDRLAQLVLEEDLKVTGFSRDDAEGKFLGRYIDQKILTRNPFETLDTTGVGRLMKLAVKEGREARSDLKCGICGEHGGDPESIYFCHELDLDYVSCSPFRVPIARLAAAQAAIRDKVKVALDK